MDDDDPKHVTPSSAGWYVTFADVISLLVTFFVMLYSMRALDSEKWDQVRGALGEAFTISQPAFRVDPNANRDAASWDRRLQRDSLSYLQGVLSMRFYGHDLLSKVTTRRDKTANELVISMPSTLLFDSGSSDLKPEGKEAVNLLADILSHFDNPIRIAGYTDDQPVKDNTFASNWELGMARALNVAALMHAGGIDADVPAVSYGQSRYSQIDPKLSEEERRQQGRRVDIVIRGEK